MISYCTHAHSTVMVSRANHLAIAAKIFWNKEARHSYARSLAWLGMTPQ